MAPKKIVPQKRRTESSSRTPPPLPEDLEKFITYEAEWLYHESLYNSTFVQKCGFPTSNVYFTFMIENKGWTKLCEHPPPGIALVVREFHSNLRFREDLRVYVCGKGVNFDAATINRTYNTGPLFQNTYYEMMMRALTKGKCEWKQHPSTFEVTTFPMAALRSVPKAWYNFLCVTLKPSLHLSTVTKDKAILLYAIVKDIKFDLGYVIESGIIE